MAKLLVSIVVLLVAGLVSSLPVDEDTVAIEAAENDIDNNIDGDDNVIDISHLGPEAYGSPNKESGEAVSKWSENSLMNPEEMGEYAEGDILMPEVSTRNGVRGDTARWPNGIIPYVIEGYFNQQQRDMIMKAIADYHRLTCLRFVPYNGQQDYLTIRSGNTGCWSSVGRIGGRQEVNLQAPGCVSKKGTVLHELLHAIGFMHEQSRPERDDFVDIRYQNIKPGSENNFKKASRDGTDDFGVGYDYNSVMHYSEYAFSRNQQKTIEPKVGGVTLGQREGLSRGDVKKVNNMYNCKKEEPQNGWVGAIWQNFFGQK
ncbi:zinc metalloproteinase nas-7-like [Pectinophora gossypiella]|uniref:zinc metalloproteinase nas-7-like n=1 Tax=Pectinophora gossypiella TaxID=13191 RepID=UPI00214F4C9F|nr:zinc metalloproteinase nas-7-like [Pectinophora gossypiella]